MEIRELLQMSQEDIREVALSLPGAKELFAENNPLSSVIVPGTAPYVLVAHMDTVYTGEPRTVIEEDGQIKVPRGQRVGVGGDDRCGCYVLFRAAEWEYSPTLLFCCDEETVNGSSVGLDSKNWSNQKCFIEIDGPGFGCYYTNDSSNSTLNSFMENKLGLFRETSSYNDIAEICSEGNPPGITLGAAYYNHHQGDKEWISLYGLDCVVETVKQFTRVVGSLDWSVVPKKIDYTHSWRHGASTPNTTTVSSPATAALGLESAYQLVGDSMGRFFDCVLCSRNESGPSCQFFAQCYYDNRDAGGECPYSNNCNLCPLGLECYVSNDIGNYGYVSKTGKEEIKEEGEEEILVEVSTVKNSLLGKKKKKKE